jgi:hypothetical protein
MDSNLYFKELTTANIALHLMQHKNAPLNEEEKKQRYFKNLSEQYQQQESRKQQIAERKAELAKRQSDFRSKELRLADEDELNLESHEPQELAEENTMIEPVFEKIDFSKINLDEALGFTTKSNIYLQADIITTQVSVIVADKNNAIAGTIFVAVKEIVLSSPEEKYLAFDFENNSQESALEITFAIDSIRCPLIRQNIVYLTTYSTLQGRMDIIDNAAVVIEAINPNDICIKSIEWNCERAVISNGGTLKDDNNNVPHDFCLQLQRLNGIADENDVTSLIEIRSNNDSPLSCRFISTISEIRCPYTVVEVTSAYDIWLRFIKVISSKTIVQIINIMAEDSRNYRFEGHFEVTEDGIPCITINEPGYIIEELGLTLKDTTLITVGTTETITSANGYNARFQNVFVNNNVSLNIIDIIGNGLFVDPNVK